MDAPQTKIRVQYQSGHGLVAPPVRLASFKWDLAMSVFFFQGLGVHLRDEPKRDGTIMMMGRWR